MSVQKEMTQQRICKINVFILSLPRTLQVLVSFVMKLYANIFDDLQGEVQENKDSCKDFLDSFMASISNKGTAA